MKKKNKVRLTESQFHKMIKKIVNEVAYRESPLYNDEGELIDTGGWYDPDDYYDPYEDKYYDESPEIARKLCSKISQGKYDKEIFNLSADDFEYYVSPDNVVAMNMLTDALYDRRALINKNYALSYEHPRITAHKDMMNYYRDFQPDYNDNYKEYNKKAMNKDYWRDYDVMELHRRYPYGFNKDGTFRYKGNLDKANKGLDMTLYGTTLHDKRPLHREGSLNRAMEESIHRNLRKLLK